MTRVVCCYSTETESEAGDSARDQELVELLPAEGGTGTARAAPARSRSAARGRAPSGGELRGGAAVGHGGSDASDEYCDTSSDEDGGEDEAARGAMMQPAAHPRRADAESGSPVRARALIGCLGVLRGAEYRPSHAQAQRIVQRLHERPQRRSRALARALTEAAALPAAGGAAAQAAMIPSGEVQTLMVPLYAPGTSD